ncbi:MAG: hydroxymethylglutaryl-CoA reductase, degradative [Flavobacteriales bacterium]|jgi:hydroxymethylglutaryl-CoA reductase|nr:hydroxymethylglutaryl-CoA reductase, degradative [Flavobacteriales bacterium]
MENKIIKGFSKLNKEEKIDWIIENYLDNDESQKNFLQSYWHQNPKTQQLHDEFIENTISNFYIPLGVAPNFKINDKVYCVPMAIEESSVVAASAKSASFWLNKGGFKADVVSMIKIGHVHFAWHGDYSKLVKFFERTKERFFQDTENLTANMRKRGGGVLSLDLINKSDLEPNYYQLMAKFDTCDSMGANFINSVLEQFAQTLKRELANDTTLSETEQKVQIIMCILSNYTPECIVRSEVSCKIEELTQGTDMSAELFVEKFQQAVHIAQIEPYRATTHNKGIYNGIDAVVIATGNDFRAVEASGHTYAARDGQYRSLTNVEVKDGIFKFWIEVPMALGTVGGLTKLHPMVKFAYQLLGNPNATELMQITATVGLAQNFGALRSLVTTGIQKGHMKMHLLNILNQLGATNEEKKFIVEAFKTKTVSHQAVVELFEKIRAEKTV